MMRWIVLALLMAQYAPSGPVFPSGPSWAHVHSISIDHTKVGSSNSSSFPVYVGGTYSWLATTAHGGQINNTTTCCANTETVPADLIFTSDSGCLTLLTGWDIPTYNATSGLIEAFVNVPTVSSSVDTTIYACTGNSLITTYQGNYTLTWNSNYKGVWHFGDGTTLDLHDSTANANTCTNTNAVTATTPLLLTGGAANFVRASSQFLGCGTGSSLNITGALQMEALFNEPSLPNSSQIPVIFSNSGNFVNGYDLLEQPNAGAAAQWMYGQADNASTQATTIDTSTGTTPPVAGVNTFVVTRYDNGGINHFDLIQNGVLESNKTISAGALGSSTSAFEIGRNPASVGYNLYWNGVLDEIRVLNKFESNDWITAQNNNFSNPATFYTVTSIR